MKKFPKLLLFNLLDKISKIRIFEEKLIQLHPLQEMKSLQHYSIGQEAISVGINSQLSYKDAIYCSFRSHAHYISKGGDIKKFIHELYLKNTGLMQGKGGSMHLANKKIGFFGSYVIVGSYIAMALGTALSMKIKKERNITVVYFGDGAMDEGILYECLNFASLKKLPILFVCENNGIASLSKNSERQANTNYTEIAKYFKIPSFNVDGQDVLKVYSLFKKVKNNIIKNGPAFINAKTYRFKAHVGAADDVGVFLRSKSELKLQRKKDPIKTLKKILIKKKIYNQKNHSKRNQKFNYFLDKCIESARRAPEPKLRNITKTVY